MQIGRSPHADPRVVRSGAAARGRGRDRQGISAGRKTLVWSAEEHLVGRDKKIVARSAHAIHTYAVAEIHRYFFVCIYLTSEEQAIRASAAKGLNSGRIRHHSDRGSQYCAYTYQDLIRKNGMQTSMSRKANCYDNAPTEIFWGTLKQEMVYHRRVKYHHQRWWLEEPCLLKGGKRHRMNNTKAQ
jgi:transposase InsO family protein